MFPQILGNKSRAIATRYGNKAKKVLRTGLKAGALLGVGLMAGQVHSALQSDASDPTYDFSAPVSFEDFGDFGSGPFRDEEAPKTTTRPQKSNPFDESGFPIMQFRE